MSDLLLCHLKNSNCSFYTHLCLIKWSHHHCSHIKRAALLLRITESKIGHKNCLVSKNSPFCLKVDFSKNCSSIYYSHHSPQQHQLWMSEASVCRFLPDTGKQQNTSFIKTLQTVLLYSNVSTLLRYRVSKINLIYCKIEK